jgi:hypothetical protein
MLLIDFAEVERTTAPKSQQFPISDVCRGSETVSHKSHKLKNDHCHIDLVARGLLCCSCNTLIGRLGDTTEAVKKRTQKILDYLDNI